MHRNNRVFNMNHKYDFTVMRHFALSSTKCLWYLRFCQVWDNTGVQAAQTFLRSRKTVYGKLKSISTNYVPGKSGNAFSVSELTALRNPSIPNTCRCGNLVDGISNTGWRESCSRKCAAAAAVERKRETCIRKYGYDNPSRVPKFKTKRQSTNLKRFGVANAFQSGKIKDKIKKTWMQNLGSTNPSGSKQVVEKRKQTSILRTGEDHWSKTKAGRKGMSDNNPMYKESTKKKIRSTTQEKYGVDCVLQAESVKKKIRATCIKKYGTHNPGVLHQYKRKSVTDIFGKVHSVQGDEPKVIEYLGRQRGIEKIVTSSRKVPQIKYWLDGKRRTYYPDILAKISGHWHLIEVKSSWTLRISLEQVIHKCRAASRFMEKKGGAYWLILMNDGKATRVKNPRSKEDLVSAGLRNLDCFKHITRS